MILQFQQQIDEMTKKAVKEFESAVLKERTDENRLSAIGNIYFLYAHVDNTRLHSLL